MKIKPAYFKFLTMFLFCSALFSGCFSTLKKNTEQSIPDFKTIAVVPFVCMDCDTSFKGVSLKAQGEITDHNASDLMTEYLIEKLKTKEGLSVVLMPEMKKEAIEAIYRGLIKTDIFSDYDAVFAGRLYHYKDRKGGNYSVSEPARVAFDMKILRVEDGQTLYYFDYDETQEPLSSNVLNIRLFLKRKGRWIKAEEMALGALEDALKKVLSE